MDPLYENHTKTLVGRVEISKVEKGEIRRKAVYLSSYESYETGSDNRDKTIEPVKVINRSVKENSGDYGVCTFATMRDLQLSFHLWQSGNWWNDNTVIHPETLALVERNEFDVVVARAVS